MSKIKKLEHGLLFLTLLFLPTQLGRHFWPTFSYVYSLPIDYLSPTIYFWDLLVAVLVVTWLFTKPHISRIALNLFLIFILSQVLSLVLGDYIKVGHGLVRVEQYLISGLFGVYMASINLKIVGKIIFWALSLAVLGEGILAILQFFKGGTLGLWIIGERTFSLSTPGIAKFDFYGTQFLRPYGTFPHPNILAGFMVIVPILLSFLRKQKSIQLLYGSRIKYGMTIVLAGITIGLTVSRAAIVAGFLEASLLLTKKWRIGLLIISLILSPIIFTRFSAVFNYDNLTLLRREQLADDALRLFASSPILGVGLNNFISASSEGIVSGPSRFLQPVHNIFLLSLSETGILGFLGLFLLIGYPVIKGYRGQVTGYRLLWAVVIFLGLFDHYFLTLPQGYRMLFLLWGMSMNVLESNYE